MPATEALRTPASPAAREQFGTAVEGGIAVDARTPWLLDDPDQAWRVASGRVDVFAVDASGLRMPLRSYGPAEVLGGAPDAGSYRIVAIAIPGTLIAPAAAADAIALADGDLAAVISGRQAMARAGDRERLSMAGLRDQEVLGEATEALASVYEEEGFEAAPDAVLGALLLLTEREGVAPPQLPKTPLPASLFLRAEALCRSTSVRPRKARLESNWWRTEGDAFIGTTADGRVVAVVPRSKDLDIEPRTKYVVVDTAAGSVEAVTPEVAATINDDILVVQRTMDGSPRRARDLLRLSRRSLRGELIWTAVLALGASITGLLVPIGLGAIVGIAVPNRQPGVAIGLVLVLVAASVSTWLFELVRNYTLLRVGGEMDRNLLPAVWDRVLRLPVPLIRSYDVGDLSSRILSVDAARQVIGESVVLSGLSAMFAIVNLLLIATVVPQLTLPAAAVLVAFAIIVVICLRASARYMDRLAALNGDRATLNLQLVQGIAKIRVAGALATMFGRWAAVLSDSQRALVQGYTRINIVMLASSVLGLSTSAVIYIFTVANASDIPVARFVVFASALSMAVAAVGSLAMVATQGVQVASQVQRIRPILTAPTEDVAGGRPIELSGAISFRDLYFQYRPEDPLALDGFTLEVPAGSFTALVGASGSGKSTALRCFLGFEQPQRGSVFLDDADLRELDPISVRRQLGVVMQRFSLIGGSILENIIGGRDLTIDDAWDAADKVDLGDFIRSLPMGMHTLIVDGGGTLSGGQVQRLLLARSIVGNPRIIVLDEATSALDNPSQAAVTQSLSRMSATRLVVAHRLSTIRDADQIAVVAGGRVVELGRHDELMALNGAYCELVRRQL